MTNTDNKKESFEQLSKLYIFDELYKFSRESSGIAFTIAYLILILSSMSYLYILYDAFGISIIKYLSFEDILATPIKNPDIILTFSVILFVFYLHDILNRFRARLELKYADAKAPLGLKIARVLIWVPKGKTANLKYVAITAVICLVSYILAFASLEANNIKEGQAKQVVIDFAEETKSTTAILLGTTANYVFTYDPVSEMSIVYSVEAISTIKTVSKAIDDKPDKT